MNKDPQIQMVVGLGNPGKEYRGSRHNIGFAVVEALAERHETGDWRTEVTHREKSAKVGGRQVVLAQPSTFMNRSGQAINALIERSGLTPAEVLVVVDDIDLDLGRLRFRRQGGPGTHNGLRDICSMVGERFPRLRVGVRGGDVWADLAAYVLSPFPEDEELLVERVVSHCADSVETAVNIDVQTAMNRFNGVRVQDQEVQGPPPAGPWPLAEVCPQRLAQWVDDDGAVVVECLRPTVRGLKSLGAWFQWWIGPQRIRLDPVGSAVWLRLDGRVSLGEVAEILSEEMPDDREHLVGRIDLFVRTLASQGVLLLE